MNCSRIKRRLQFYIDNQLSIEETNMVEDHIGRCLACRERLNSLKKTIALLEGLEDVDPPSNFDLPILKQVASSKIAPLPSPTTSHLKTHLRWPTWKKVVSLSLPLLIGLVIVHYLWEHPVWPHFLIKRGTHLLIEGAQLISNLKGQLVELLKGGILLLQKVIELIAVLSKALIVFMENFNPGLLTGILLLYAFLSMLFIKAMKKVLNHAHF